MCLRNDYCFFRCLLYWYVILFSLTSLSAQEDRSTAADIRLTNEIYAVAWNYPSKGLDVAQGFIDRARKIEARDVEAHGHIFMADCYIMMGDFALAIQHLLKARDIADQYQITYLDQRISRPYGRIYIELGNPERAILHEKQGLANADEQKEITISSHSLAEAYLEAGKLDSARILAEDLYARAGTLWGALPHLLGNVYLRLGRFEEALQVFRTRSGLSYDFDQIGNLIGQAKAQAALQHLDSCRALAEQALEMSMERKFTKYIHQSAGVLADAYQNIDEQAYIKYLLISQQAYKQMYGKEKMSAFNEFIFSDQSRRQELAEAKLRFASRQRTLIFGGILSFFLLIGGGLWKNNLQKAKSNAMLKKEKRKVEQSMAQLKTTQGKLLRSEKLARELEKQEADRLRELDSLKTKFFTNVTHEFRTPLTVIMGMNETIAGYDHERKLIRRNAESLLNMINQILDLSKLESGALGLDIVHSDIVSYLHYLTESFYSMASDKKVMLSFESSLDRLDMDFDENKVRQVIYNLLSNGIKFTRPGGKVGLLVSRQKVQGQDDRVKIQIKDTGIGISQADLPRIFDRFHQAEQMGQVGGTGIGLTLTKELVELMGGIIKVQSEPSWGTSFTILLPIEAKSNKPLDLPLTENRSMAPNNRQDVDYLPVAPDQIRGEQPIVLVIEDNEGVVNYINSLLKPHYQVINAMNGELGIELAIDHIPDLIISDVMMPEKNGFEVCDILKKDERTNHIPIILLTAKADFSSKLTGLNTGADAYLVKPFEKEELLVRIEKLMEVRSSLHRKYEKLFQGFQKGYESEETNAGEMPSNPFLEKLRADVLENIDDNEINIAELSKRMHMSHTQFYRKTKALTGKTPSQFVRSVKWAQAIKYLKETDLQITEIAYSLGFTDPNYFSRMFKQDIGKSPREVRIEGKV